jgi:hypothetical protein
MMVPKKKKAAASTTTAAAPKTITITYNCVLGTCLPSKKKVHMHPGDTVNLVAGNRDVSITFDLASPFVSHDGYPAPIVIPAGTTHAAETVDTTIAAFSYTYSCSKPHCASPVDNPQMIVES